MIRKHLVAIAALIAITAAPAAASAQTPSEQARQDHVGQACWVTDNSLSCYPNEAAMDAAIAADTAQTATTATTAPATTQSTCPTVLKLYDGTGYGPAVLALGTRGTWIDLTVYGFGSRTSSYVVGSCSTTFKDANYTTYPGYTGAGAASPSMSSGWDNRITRIYIY